MGIAIPFSGAERSGRAPSPESAGRLLTRAACIHDAALYVTSVLDAERDRAAALATATVQATAGPRPLGATAATTGSDRIAQAREALRHVEIPSSEVMRGKLNA